MPPRPSRNIAGSQIARFMVSSNFGDPKSLRMNRATGGSPQRARIPGAQVLRHFKLPQGDRAPCNGLVRSHWRASDLAQYQAPIRRHPCRSLGRAAAPGIPRRECTFPPSADASGGETEDHCGTPSLRRRCPSAGTHRLEPVHVQVVREVEDYEAREGGEVHEHDC